MLVALKFSPHKHRQTLSILDEICELIGEEKALRVIRNVHDHTTLRELFWRISNQVALGESLSFDAFPASDGRIKEKGLGVNPTLPQENQALLEQRTPTEEVATVVPEPVPVRAIRKPKPAPKQKVQGTTVISSSNKAPAPCDTPADTANRESAATQRSRKDFLGRYKPQIIDSRKPSPDQKPPRRERRSTASDKKREEFHSPSSADVTTASIQVERGMGRLQELLEKPGRMKAYGGEDGMFTAKRIIVSALKNAYGNPEAQEDVLRIATSAINLDDLMAKLSEL